MKKFYEEILWKKIKERNAEKERVRLLIKEGGKQSPGKDYWHKLIELENSVKILQRMVDVSDD